ncbi:hypothetical protein FACS1894105_04070 [Clostridia bacterium]|nr:hypothetical protein FACS1894105_04070 [Clostridia bacterium]
MKEQFPHTLENKNIALEARVTLYYKWLAGIPVIETFSETVRPYMITAGWTPIKFEILTTLSGEIYRTIYRDSDYYPAFATVFCICLALNLTLWTSISIMRSAGYTLQSKNHRPYLYALDEMRCESFHDRNCLLLELGKTSLDKNYR